MSEKIQVIVKRPFEPTTVAAIEEKLETYQRLVGGLIECVPFPGMNGNNVDIVLNEEGKFLPDCKPNIIVPEYEDTFMGTLVVVGVNDEGAFIGLNNEQIENATEYLDSHSVIYLGGLYIAPDFSDSGDSNKNSGSEM